MKFDSFVKVMLVLIALFLGIIALKPFFETQFATENLGGKKDYIQVWCSSCVIPGLPYKSHFIFFNSNTGDIWAYSDEALAGKSNPIYLGRLKALGQPVTK